MERQPGGPFDLRANFAAALREWRRRQRLELKQAAAILGFGIATLSAWERGTRFPKPEHLRLVFQYTGLAPCRLFCARTGHCPPPRCAFVKRHA